MPSLLRQHRLPQEGDRALSLGAGKAQAPDSRRYIQCQHIGEIVLDLKTRPFNLPDHVLLTKVQSCRRTMGNPARLLEIQVHMARPRTQTVEPHHFIAKDQQGRCRPLPAPGTEPVHIEGDTRPDHCALHIRGARTRATARQRQPPGEQRPQWRRGDSPQDTQHNLASTGSP
tara:strand:+ start:49956 stop:50471 length:516 start_codon:yes stop_codon:yes gene_type:complete